MLPLLSISVKFLNMLFESNLENSKEIILLLFSQNFKHDRIPYAYLEILTYSAYFSLSCDLFFVKEG